MAKRQVVEVTKGIAVFENIPVTDGSNVLKDLTGITVSLDVEDGLFAMNLKAAAGDERGFVTIYATGANTTFAATGTFKVKVIGTPVVAPNPPTSGPANELLTAIWMVVKEGKDD